MSSPGDHAVRDCRQCSGSGECFQCGARGSIVDDLRGTYGCRSCGGSGRCVLCAGKGEVAHPANEVVRSPAISYLNS
jgi:hypothetical protein